jgi:hypothetical protein
MLLLIDIFSINKGRGYENPSLEIIVTEHCSTGGFPLEEACEHCFLNQSAISVVVLILFLCYCGDYAGYITVILPFLAFYFCSAYLLYLVSCIFLLASQNILFLSGLHMEVNTSGSYHISTLPPTSGGIECNGIEKKHTIQSVASS